MQSFFVLIPVKPTVFLRDPSISGDIALVMLSLALSLYLNVMSLCSSCSDVTQANVSSGLLVWLSMRPCSSCGERVMRMSHRNALS